MYGRACAFFDACTGAASLDDTSRFERVENGEASENDPVVFMFSLMVRLGSPSKPT